MFHQHFCPNLIDIELCLGGALGKAGDVVFRGDYHRWVAEELASGRALLRIALQAPIDELGNFWRQYLTATWARRDRRVRNSTQNLFCNFTRSNSVKRDSERTHIS